MSPLVSLGGARSFCLLHPLFRIDTEDQPHRHFIAICQLQNYARDLSNASGSLAVISAVTLSNSQSYRFDYSNNPYGLVDQITYPTGGWIKYTWALNPQSEIGSYSDALGNANSCVYSYDWPAVQHRYVSFDGINRSTLQR